VRRLKKILERKDVSEVYSGIEGDKAKKQVLEITVQITRFIEFFENSKLILSKTH